MTEPRPPGRSFLDELKRRRVGRVAIGYAAAVFVVLQAADIIFPALGIPDGGFRALVIASLVGFPIAIALAWLFQWTPEGLRRTGSDDDGPVVAGLKRARGIVLGAVLVLLVAIAAMVVRPTGTTAGPLRTDVIAVVPFSTTGGGDPGMGEGLVDLLSRNLDEVEGLRLIDPRIVLHRWRQVSADGPVTRDVERDIAREVGAGSMLTGRVANLGGEVSVVAELRAIDGEVLAAAEVRGTNDDLLGLVDRLSVALLREIWQATTAAPVPELAEITTDDVDAMRLFLTGERRYRESAWPEALSAYAGAVEADPQFAFAYYRMARTLSWVGSGDGRQSTYTDLALALSTRLPERIRALAVADRLWLDGAREEAIDSLEALTERYPDDPEVRFRLADNRYHELYEGAGPLAPDIVEQTSAFEHVLELDPTFLPAVIHPLEVALRYGDVDRVDRYTGVIETASPGDSAAAAMVSAARALVTSSDDVEIVRATFEAIVAHSFDASGMARQVILAVRPAALRAGATLPASDQTRLIAWLRDQEDTATEASPEARALLVNLLSATGRLERAASEAGLASRGVALAARRDPVYAGYVDAEWLSGGELEPTALVAATGRIAEALWRRDAAALRAAIDAARTAETGETGAAWAALIAAGDAFLAVLSGDPGDGLDRVESALRTVRTGAGSFSEPLWFLWLDLSIDGDDRLARVVSILERPWSGAAAFEVRRLGALARALEANGRTAEAAAARDRFTAALAGADAGLPLYGVPTSVAFQMASKISDRVPVASTNAASAISSPRSPVVSTTSPPPPSRSGEP